MSDLAIYDMDRTVTRGPTYTPFLLHCALRRAPWRLIFLPLVILSMLAYVARLIDRAKLKEINHALLLGPKIHPKDLAPLVESFADSQVASNIRPGARKAIARDKAEGRRLVLATASYRLYADAIAQRLGFDDVIGTGSIIGLDEPRPREDPRRELLRAGQAADDFRLGREVGPEGRARPRPLLFRPCSDQPAFEWADEPVAVNPHGKLRRLAHERGWAVEDWG